MLAPRFEFYASSPHIITDWRWYKAIVGDDWGFNLQAIEQFWAQAHNLLDYRKVLPPRDPLANQRLYDLCTAARAQLERFERRRDFTFMANFRELLGKITEDVRYFSNDVAEALAEAAELIGADRPDARAVGEAAKFGALFGRGQQYISLTRMN